MVEASQATSKLVEVYINIQVKIIKEVLVLIGV